MSAQFLLLIALHRADKHYVMDYYSNEAVKEPWLYLVTSEPSARGLGHRDPVITLMCPVTIHTDTQPEIQSSSNSDPAY